MSRKAGPPQSRSTAQPVDQAYDLWLTKRKGKAAKDYATYGNQVKLDTPSGKRPKNAMNYVAPGGGGY